MINLAATLPDRGSISRIFALALTPLLLIGAYTTFLPAKVQAAACTASTDYGSASSMVQITDPGVYRIWSHIMAPDATANSYLLEIDGSNCYTVGDSGLSSGAWTWVDYQNGAASSKTQQNLAAGNHTVKMIGREAKVKLDRLLFVADLNCVPTGTGDNCATAGDTEVPAIDLTTPASGATIANTSTIAANATDNVGITKVEFYINGSLKSADTTSPYTYNWDTAGAQNGNTSLMVKAYDAAGNSNSDSVQVMVANGDTQTPSTPLGVSAQAQTYDKVTVKWNASTDNTAVTGYWVSRDGVILDKVTTGTQYVDTNTLPNTTYSYQVTAFDAAGNTSALSNEAKATTPDVPDTVPPSTPTGIKAQAASSSQINLSWNASTDNIGVASYDIYRGTTANNATKVATVRTTSYGDTGLSATTEYSYYIIARDQAGNSSQKSASAIAKTATPPQKQATIRGHVMLRGPQQTTTITINVNGSKRIVRTDSQGNYMLPSLPAGRYIINYQAPGHYTKKAAVKVKIGQVKTKNITLRKR